MVDKMKTDEFDMMFADFLIKHLKSVREELYNHVLNDFINDETTGKLSDIVSVDNKGKVKKTIQNDDPFVKKFNLCVNEQFSFHIGKILDFKIQFELYNDILFISKCKFFYIRIKNLSRSEIIIYHKLINYFDKITTNDCVLSILKQIKCKNGENKRKIENKLKFILLEKYTDTIIIMLNYLFVNKKINLESSRYFFKYITKKISDIMVAKKISIDSAFELSNLKKMLLSNKN